MNELLPSFQDDDADSIDGATGLDGLPNGHMRVPSDSAKLDQEPLFPEVDALRALFRDSFKELIDLKRQVLCNNRKLRSIFIDLNFYDL